MDHEPVIDSLRRALPDASFEAGTATDMPTFYVERDRVLDVCRLLRDEHDLQFTFLSDITAVDVWPVEPRFEVVYHLACVGAAYPQPGGAAQARRLRVKVRLDGADAHLASVTSVWSGAGWMEREVFDLFGVVFDEHPDLRRILMTDDWQGHPLRKDYPVQIRKETSSASALQITAEEFAANVRAVRQGAVDQARSGPFDKLKVSRDWT